MLAGRELVERDVDRTLDRVLERHHRGERLAAAHGVERGRHRVVRDELEVLVRRVVRVDELHQRVLGERSRRAEEGVTRQRPSRHREPPRIA